MPVQTANGSDPRARSAIVHYFELLHSIEPESSDFFSEAGQGVAV